MSGFRRAAGAGAVVAVLAGLPTAGPASALDGDLEALEVAIAPSEDGLPGGPVRALAVGRDGLLWVATGSGLARYDGARFRRFDARHPPEPPTGAPAALAAGADGRLWVGGARGLAAWDGTSFEPLPAVPGPDPAVLAVAAAPDGALWIGTRAAGACRLGSAGWECFGAARGLPSEEVRALAFDRGGAAWAATPGGTARFDGARFATLSQEPAETLAGFGDGVLAGGARAVLELPAGRALVERGETPASGVLARALLVEDDGDVWIGGSHLARRRAGALLLDVDRAGQLGAEVTALAADGEGHLWIGTADGTLRRAGAAGRDGTALAAPPAIVDAVLADGRALAATGAAGELRVPAGTERVEIAFTAAAFARPAALVFRYRLSGYERAWQDARGVRRATYTRLPPGRYRFEVAAARGPDGGAGAPPAALALTVEPRWHQTAAVRLLAAAAAAAALALAHRWRLARLRRRERELAAEVAARTADLRRLNEDLGRLVEEQTGQIRETRDMAVLTLARLAELRDGTTGEHLDRIAWYSRCLAQALADGPFGPLGEEFVEELYRSSPLHDIGKVAIPDAILCKAGPLDAAERRIMESHTTIGGDTLRGVIERAPAHSFLSMAMEIAYGHHERWDGAGYPRRLGGEAVPLPARIVALVDAYDAITSARPYKPGLAHEEAVRRILADAGRHFDPRLVEGFRAAHADLDAIRRAHPQLAGS